jgi:HlyD family secretion protein
MSKRLITAFLLPRLGTSSSIILDGVQMRNCARYCLVLTASFAILFGACTRPSPPSGYSATSSEKTAVVKRGSFRRTIRLTGGVRAVESYTVLAPRLSGQMMGTGNMVITGIVRNGVSVRKGDILVELDRQNQEKNILDRQAEYDGLVQQIRRKQADQLAARSADETELKSAEVDIRIAQVEMRKNEVIPVYQAEINKANLAESEAQLNQLKETFALKRQAETADLRILEIQRDRAKSAVEYAQGNVEKMTIRSPMDGLVVLTPLSKGTRMVDPQEGDEVRTGGNIMLVVNPSAMQVLARVNQVDIENVRIGQSAEIRLDAYPDLLFPGKVENISAIVIAGSGSKRIRHFSATISIRGANPRLLPDLTASVDVPVQSLENVLMLPRSAIIHEKGQTAVQVMLNGKLERRLVKIGAMNESDAVIESGLQEGVAVSLDPQL